MSHRDLLAGNRGVGRDARLHAAHALRADAVGREAVVVADVVVERVEELLGSAVGEPPRRERVVDRRPSALTAGDRQQLVRVRRHQVAAALVAGAGRVERPHLASPGERAREHRAHDLPARGAEFVSLDAVVGTRAVVRSGLAVVGVAALDFPDEVIEELLEVVVEVRAVVQAGAVVQF
ncbi:hypothetical protein ACFQFD_19380 [Halobaculum halobium]|uniref:Uncharacterized protein n=1 Tax=Halobaculum halobium TaxID=3032281 RepID=A0ABD5TFD0_9EURY